MPKAKTFVNRQPISYELARMLMGKNFYGIRYAVDFYGLSKDVEDQLSRSTIPYSEKKILAHREDARLVLYPGLPISYLYNMVRPDVLHRLLLKFAPIQKLFHEHDYDQCRNKETFIEKHGEISWWLIPEALHRELFEKDWSAQQFLLPKDEETPPSYVMVYAIVTHFLATGKWLFEKATLRCSDLDSKDRRITVGCWDTTGFGGGAIDITYDFAPGTPGVGVASAYKHDVTL
jgi:hypothetical protein